MSSFSRNPGRSRQWVYEEAPKDYGSWPRVLPLTFIIVASTAKDRGQEGKARGSYREARSHVEGQVPLTSLGDDQIPAQTQLDFFGMYRGGFGDHQDHIRREYEARLPLSLRRILRLSLRVVGMIECENLRGGTLDLLVMTGQLSRHSLLLWAQHQVWLCPY